MNIIHLYSDVNFVEKTMEELPLKDILSGEHQDLNVYIPITNPNYDDDLSEYSDIDDFFLCEEILCECDEHEMLDIQ